MTETELLSRWRLCLGRGAEAHGVALDPSDDAARRADDVLEYVFGPQEGDADGAPRGGGRETSTMTVPRWVDAVSELFPREAKEVLERELVHRKGLAKLMNEPDLLARIEPNVEIVKTLLTHRGLLDDRTRGLARKIIEQVVEQLRGSLRVTVERAITGALRRDRHSPRKVFRNLDLKTTIRRNLQHWDVDRRRLVVDRTWFHAAERRQRPWHVIVCVDQSGSMLESAIFSAVMASIFAALPAMRTSLVLFDTQVVDLSDQVKDPVDVLLGIQLGGGTDITQALQYCATLTREPARTICVLVTDFYEGRAESDLVAQVRSMSEAGVRMVGLGALGYDARPQIHRATANKCRKVGMDVLVCTPERLAESMAHILRG